MAPFDYAQDKFVFSNAFSQSLGLLTEHAVRNTQYAIRDNWLCFFKSAMSDVNYKFPLTTIILTVISNIFLMA
ncbi:MAG: hypothetical protein CEE38_08570 [Planctomycetes bacterium B3_Pla]|nr:MAG: hypothetical protein CEE38_08570 [Planctomycetes bacterium B3_Pla]